LQIQELKRFLLFLRDTFEVILPRPIIADSPINLQSISVENEEKSDGGKFIKSESETLASLVQSKPWNQLAWNDLYSYYKLKNYKSTHLSPIDFTIKFKSYGFCLKYGNGNVVHLQELEGLRLADNKMVTGDRITTDYKIATDDKISNDNKITLDNKITNTMITLDKMITHDKIITNDKSIECLETMYWHHLALNHS
jgi:hypothetical protein